MFLCMSPAADDCAANNSIATSSGAGKRCSALNDPSAHERRSEKTLDRRLFERSSETGDRRHGDPGAGMTALADALARLVRIRDALDDADVAYAVALAGDLETHLAATLALERAA